MMALDRYYNMITSQRYPNIWFATAGNGGVLPLGNATYVIEVSPAYHFYDIHVRFFDDDDGIAPPTAGQIRVRAGVLPGQFLEPNVGTGIVQASETGATAAYTIPRFEGPTRFVRAVVSGVSGGSATGLEIAVIASGG